MSCTSCATTWDKRRKRATNGGVESRRSEKHGRGLIFYLVRQDTPDIASSNNRGACNRTL